MAANKLYGSSPPLKRTKFLTPKIPTSGRRPLSEISPNTKSPPIPIPKISVSCLDDDEVFDPSAKENFRPGCGLRTTLFPSYGTSPSHAFKLDENSLQQLSGKLTDNLQIKRLGKGSFGTVVLGTWKGERVAIKVIRRRSSLESELNARTLCHDNVAKIKDVIEDTNDDDGDECSILVMEYVGQHNLKALIEQKSSDLTTKIVKSFLLQIAEGLKHCHDNLIVHLDIKPANILVTSSGQCKLADFGCSQRLLHRELSQSIEAGSCFGTPGYQAPEMFTLKKVHAKSDIFSFGIVMWQVLLKEADPYPGQHPHTIIFNVVSKHWRPCKETAKHWKKYEPLYKSCWEHDYYVRPDIRMVLNRLMTLSKTSSGPMASPAAKNSSSETCKSSETRRKSSGMRI